MSILNIDFIPTKNISAITDFSKDVKKDSIFFALDGVNNHGTSYIDEVISKDPMHWVFRYNFIYIGCAMVINSI